MTRKILLLVCMLLLLPGCKSKDKEAAIQEESSGGTWIRLFNGQTFNGWKASENPSTFKIQAGMIVVSGPRAHLFYEGPVENADFKNFEFKADIMTKPGANSGIFFHTEYQETDWPQKGYEVQVNNSHSDWKRTGGLYDVVDVRESPVKDDEWFTEHIIVRGKHIVIKVNGETTVDFTEPDDFKHATFPNRKISSGTFAIQGHDPNSTVYYKNIQVKPLPE
jgi:hypothetical protein